MPSELKLGIFNPIHKNGDMMNYNTMYYTMYKVLSGVMQNCINTYAEEILGENQCGFEKNGSTIYTHYAKSKKNAINVIDIQYLWIVPSV